MSGLIVIDNQKVALPDAKNKGAEEVAKFADRLVRVLPSDADRAQFAIALVVAANEIDAKYAGNTKAVLSAAFSAARLNLIPGSALGLSYFVPFKGVINLIPGYKGYLDLAAGNGFIRWVSTEVVYRGEEFRYWHDERGHHITHEIPIDRSDDDRDIIAAYCSYQTRTGDTAIPVVVNRQKIDAARNTNKCGDVWGKHFAEMAMKTAIRRAAKRWKLTPQLGRAIYLDELAERGEPQPMELPEGVEVIQTQRPSLADGRERSPSFTKFREAIEATPNDDEEGVQSFYPDILSAEQDGSLTPGDANELRAMLAGKGTMFA